MAGQAEPVEQRQQRSEGLGRPTAVGRPQAGPELAVCGIDGCDPGGGLPDPAADRIPAQPQHMDEIAQPAPGVFAGKGQGRPREQGSGRDLVLQVRDQDSRLLPVVFPLREPLFPERSFKFLILNVPFQAVEGLCTFLAPCTFIRGAALF